MNIEESSHSVVKRDGKIFNEIPQEISYSTRSFQNNFSGNMPTTIGGGDPVTYIPIVHILNYINEGNQSYERTGHTIRIKRFQVCFNISAALSEETGWQPFEYKDDTMTDFPLYLKRKLVDSRIRIIACNQRRKLAFIPGALQHPFYTQGVGQGQIQKPIETNINNSHMVEQLDARSYETHYDDTKNLFDRSSATPNLTFYQDFQIDSVYEYEDEDGGGLRYGDHGLKEKVPDIWLYTPYQYDAENDCQLYFNCSVRVLYDCM